MTSRDPDEELYDLGNGVKAEWWTLSAADGSFIRDAMVVEHHTCKTKDDKPYEGMGSVPVDPRVLIGSPHWIVIAGTIGTFEGLTLSPSILCQNCGLHGFIRNGRWESA